jgi:hypothetical protein
VRKALWGQFCNATLQFLRYTWTKKNMFYTDSGLSAKMQYKISRVNEPLRS